MDDGKIAWQANAEYWDSYMGDYSNSFHREIVRPSVDELLDINKGDLVLDIGCGNGNYSSYIAQKGAKVVAFDYSENMINLATKRRAEDLDKIKFVIADASKEDEIIALKQEKLFTKAVSLMAIMDICDIKPLFRAVYSLLDKDGIFVFATHHPCFTYPNEDYFTSCIDKGYALEGQPMLHNYYHRSISEILANAFSSGFVLDRFVEVPFKGEKVPIIMTIRLKKYFK